jgi:UDP-N-acetylglucosamine 2-epimerase
MKIASIVGARPQFVKAVPVSRALQRAGRKEVLIHTGQHYDYRMSQVFFDEMGLSPPAYNLGVGSGSHGKQTGEMLARIEAVLIAEQPDVTVVYGDTNSTIAGAVASVKLGIPLAHVEAGLRSFNRSMPEEHNRVLTDHCADLLFCPTEHAVVNLAREGISQGVYRVGDPMYDAVLQFSAAARERSRILEQLGLTSRAYFLATVHRASNTDAPGVLRDLLATFRMVDAPVVFPVHPRTRQRLHGEALPASNVRMIDPVGYLDMLVLEANARAVLTDSGGVQKEAFFFGVPCITMRTETEWVETVAAGWNVVVGNDGERILAATLKTDWPTSKPPPVFGEGDAASRIVDLLEKGVTSRSV